MRKLILLFALIGVIYVGTNIHACYRHVFPPPPKSALTSSDTTPRLAPSKPSGPKPLIPEMNKGSLVFAGTYAEILRRIAVLLSLPGAWMLRALSLPENTLLLCLAIVSSWRFLSTSLRLGWIVPGRVFGWYSPRSFRFWLWLSPPWRPIFGAVRPILRWLRYWKYGRSNTDKWASPAEIFYHVYRRGRIFLGRASFWNLPLFQPVGVKGERHIAMIAAPGSGKTTQLITMAALEPGNVFAIDCDGQIVRAIGQHLNVKGKTVLKLDPFSLAPGFPGAEWNAIAELDDAVERYGEAAAVEFAATLSEALIKTVPGVNEWIYKEARVFMTSLILYVWRWADPGNRNLVYLRKLLTLGRPDLIGGAKCDAFTMLLVDMAIREDFDGVIAAGAEMIRRSMGGKGDNKSHVLATCIEQTAWLDFPRMAAISKRSSFHCRNLKSGKACLFIVAPLTDIQDKLSGWVRALTVMTMYAFQRAVDERPKHPTLFALDEFPHLGHLSIVQTAAGGFRKFGIRLLTIAQTIGQLKAVYPQTWSDFLGTSECVVWMTNGDQETREYLSRILGKTTQEPKVSGGLLSRLFTRLRPHIRREERDLMTSGQLRDFLRDNSIVTRANDRPMRLKPEPYYKALPVSWYEADKFYGETYARALTRRVVRCLRWAATLLLTALKSMLQHLWKVAIRKKARR